MLSEKSNLPSVPLAIPASSIRMSAALIACGDRPLHRADLSTQPLHSRKQLLFFFGNSDRLSFLFCVSPHFS